jgi:hypothetical protein
MAVGFRKDLGDVKACDNGFAFNDGKGGRDLGSHWCWFDGSFPHSIPLVISSRYILTLYLLDSEVSN